MRTKSKRESRAPSYMDDNLEGIGLNADFTQLTSSKQLIILSVKLFTFWEEIVSFLRGEVFKWKSNAA